MKKQLLFILIAVLCAPVTVFALSGSANSGVGQLRLGETLECLLGDGNCKVDCEGSQLKREAHAQKRHSNRGVMGQNQVSAK